MKRIGIFFLLFVFLFALCGCSTMMLELENGVKQLTNAFTANENVYEYDDCTLVVCDRADVMTDEEESELVAAISPYCNNVQCDILIITTDAPSMSATSYGGAYVSAFFPGGSEDNISFIIDMNHGEWWIRWHGYLADRLPDWHADRAFDLADKHLRNEDYCEGFKAMATYMLTEIDKIEH